MPGPGENLATTLPDDLAGDFGVDLNDGIEINVVEDDEPLFAPEKTETEHETEPTTAQGDVETAAPVVADLENDAVAEAAAKESRIRAEYERKLAEQTAESEERAFKDQKEKLTIQKDAFKLSLDGIDVRMQTATEALKIARIDGDSNSEIEIEQQLNELRRVRGQIENNMAQLPSEEQLDQAYKQHVAKRRDQAKSNDGYRPLNAKAEVWAQQNSAWFNRDQRAMKTLLAVNESLAAEGFKPEADEFFVELSARMQRAHPDIGIKGSQPRSADGRFGHKAPQSPPVASVRSTAPVSPDPKQQARKNQVNLDGSDRRMMRTLGIDLESKEAVQRFAREKLMRMKREAAGG